MLKKMLLLASAVMALAAFAVPAAAQANQWYTHTEGTKHLVGSTTATGDHLSLTGNLATTAGPGFAFRSGPCAVHADVTLWNANGQATGEVSKFTITTPTPCETSIPGCVINEAGSLEESFPWPIDVSEDSISITGATFFNVYNDGCTALGIPPGVKLGGSGTATGEFNTESDCIEFNNAGDLTGGLGPIHIDGEVCNSSGNTLTLG